MNGALFHIMENNHIRKLNFSLSSDYVHGQITGRPNDTIRGNNTGVTDMNLSLDINQTPSLGNTTYSSPSNLTSNRLDTPPSASNTIGIT